MNKNDKNKAIWGAIGLPKKDEKKDAPRNNNQNAQVRRAPLANTGQQQNRVSTNRTTRSANPNHSASHNHANSGAHGPKARTHQYSKFKGKPKAPTNITAKTTNHRKVSLHNIPDLETGVLRIIPLGGVEQVGQNMTAIEYGNDIIVIDVGLQFAEADHPGIDYIIPNTKYLEDRKDKIRGIFITHGHLDHIGAMPYVIEKIGNPPIYSRQFGAVMIAKRHEEFPHLPKLNMNILGPEETIRITESFIVNTFAISHTIPDSMGIVIQTPLGDIAFIEDVRVDNIAGVPTDEEIEQYKRFKDREMLLLTMDSTSIWKAGWSLSEQVVAKNITEIIRKVPGRIIIGSFASQVERIVSIIEAAETFGKKIVIDGRSMKTNMEIAKQLGILKSKNLITVEEMASYPPNKILMLATGSQGEEFAALARMANKSHRQIVLQESDTILLSSSAIPGNEGDIDKLKDNLYRSGAKIITYTDSDVHASGHGNKEELRWIHKQINYKFFMPVHGNHYMLCQHSELSQAEGHAKENIVVPDNGSIIEIYDPINKTQTISKKANLKDVKIRVRKEKAPSDLVMVDGFAVGDTQEYVIRDRVMLAQDGIFIVMAIVDNKTGKLRKSPDIISRGFVYLKESQDLLHQARGIVKKTIEEKTASMNPIDFEYIKNVLGDNLSKYLYQQTAKRPLVISVVLSV